MSHGLSKQTGIGLIAAAVCGCATLPSVQRRTAFTEAIPLPEVARAANERGLRLVAQDDYAGAEAAFREALLADVSMLAPHSNLGLILLKKGRFHESATEFSVAIGLDPRAAEPLINLGRLYETVGWHDAAAGQYEKALALDEDNPQALGRLAYVYTRSAKNQRRNEALLRRLARDADNEPWKQWALARLEGHSGAGPEQVTLPHAPTEAATAP